MTLFAFESDEVQPLAVSVVRHAERGDCHEAGINLDLDIMNGLS